MRSAMKRVLRATTPDEASQALPEAFKRVDKAAKRKVIHDNAAARFKRQLSLAARTKGQ
jgi:ribosomal protein S20